MAHRFWLTLALSLAAVVALSPTSSAQAPSAIQQGRGQEGGNREREDFRRGYRDGFGDGYEDGRRRREPPIRGYVESAYERGYSEGYQAGFSKGRAEAPPRRK